MTGCTNSDPVFAAGLVLVLVVAWLMAWAAMLRRGGPPNKPLRRAELPDAPPAGVPWSSFRSRNPAARPPEHPVIEAGPQCRSIWQVERRPTRRGE